jgi:mRNA interferase MazF
MVRQGDIIYLNFSPTEGREQHGKRPALVISQTVYNEKRKMILACPITSTVKPLRMRVQLDERTETHGDVLCEQVRIFDLLVREYDFKERVPRDVLSKVLEVVRNIVAIEDY